LGFLCIAYSRCARCTAACRSRVVRLRIFRENDRGGALAQMYVGEKRWDFWMLPTGVVLPASALAARSLRPWGLAAVRTPSTRHAVEGNASSSGLWRSPERRRPAHWPHSGCVTGITLAKRYMQYSIHSE
jgi:hypothetical protein